MEFGEKLQELRKSKGFTQEELAEALYVSRTAVSKWESGRGYPSIDSLKEISKFFSVTIDDLLSADALICLAETENKANVQNVCDLLFGMMDLCALILMVLPLYPKTVDGCIYSVNLFAYTEAAQLNRSVYWVLFLLLVFLGLLKVLLTQFRKKRYQKQIAYCSMMIGIAAVICLVLAGETYAAAAAFLLLGLKTMLLFKYMKADH